MKDNSWHFSCQCTLIFMLYNASKHLGFTFCTFTIFMVVSHAGRSCEDNFLLLTFMCKMLQGSTSM